ncbi:MAG: class I SAM-dependent methyltransferase [Acidobacteriota bacterium]
MKTDYIFRQLAWFYDLTFRYPLKGGHRETARELRECGSLKVAELGVGPGHSLPYYPDGTELYGVDVSSEMIKMARKRAGKYPNLKPRLEVMDATNTSFPENFFDVVISFSVITVVDQPESLLKEALRICKPGGKIFIVGRMKRQGLADKFHQKIMSPVTLLLFGYRTTLDQKIYEVISRDVTILERRLVNYIGPVALSDMMILRKNEI